MKQVHILFDKLKHRTSVFLEGDSATANHGVPWISPSLLSIRGYTWIYDRSRMRTATLWSWKCGLGRQPILILDVNFLSM